MTTHTLVPGCPACTPPRAASPASPPPSKLPWLALLPALLAGLAPKCPLCLAAYLSAFGVTLGMAGFALTVLRPLALVSAALAFTLLTMRALRRFRRAG